MPIGSSSVAYTEATYVDPFGDGSTSARRASANMSISGGSDTRNVSDFRISSMIDFAIGAKTGSPQVLKRL
jgi:hypothetical protein